MLTRRFMKGRLYKTISGLRLSARFAGLVLAALCVAGSASAREGRLVRETVHAVSLEKNVTGESPDRSVTVYLPPGYDREPAKRYAVVYLLHGIMDTDATWTRPWRPGNEGWATVKEVMDGGIAARRFGEMIVVMPDGRTKWGGSFYTNSAATGNWEDFVVKDLVAHVDAKYRTLARAAARGIAGHSMGGYGAIKLGMKHPDVFSVVYGLNPAVLGWGADLTPENPAIAYALGVKTPEEALKGGVYSLGTVVVAQAFSPNPGRPPLFVDFPFESVGGRLRPSEPAFSRWQENFPANMVGKYRANLSKLRGLKFDSGYEDEFTHIPVTARALSAALSGHGVEHVFEEYNGDHRNRLWGRTGRLATEVFPYFWLLLDAHDAK